MIWGVAPDPIRFFEKKAKQKTIRLVLCDIVLTIVELALKLRKIFPCESFCGAFFKKRPIQILTPR